MHAINVFEIESPLSEFFGHEFFTTIPCKLTGLDEDYKPSRGHTIQEII